MSTSDLRIYVAVMSPYPRDRGVTEFEMKDLSEAKKVLDIEIEKNHKGDKISLTQKGYLKKVL